MHASLVVYPVRIVIPVEPKKLAVDTMLGFWNYVLHRPAVLQIPTYADLSIVQYFWV